MSRLVAGAEKAAETAGLIPPSAEASQRSAERIATDRLLLQGGDRIRVRPDARRLLLRIALPFAALTAVGLLLGTFFGRRGNGPIQWDEARPLIPVIVGVGLVLFLSATVIPVLIVTRDAIVFHRAELRQAMGERAEIVLVRSPGRRVFRMNGNHWPVARVIEVLRADEVPVVEVDKRVDSKRFRREFPGMMPWWLRLYPLAASFLGAILVIIGLVLADRVWWLITGQGFMVPS